MNDVRRGWNPKNLGVQEFAGLETDVWCYLIGRKLEIVIQVKRDSVIAGTVTYQVKLPT